MIYLIDKPPQLADFMDVADPELHEYDLSCAEAEFENDFDWSGERVSTFKVSMALGKAAY